jgi:hypothetical protein
MSRCTTRVTALSIAILVCLATIGCGRYAVPLKTRPPETPPPPDTARVYFINPGAPAGDPTVFILKETELIGYLEGKKAACVDLPAGEHFFMSLADNLEGVYAKLAGGKTYYLLLSFTPGPQTPMGGETVNAFLNPLVPGDDDWTRRHEWVDRVQLVALNQRRAEDWSTRWSERNQRRFLQFKNGEKKYALLTPDQGE